MWPAISSFDGVSGTPAMDASVRARPTTFAPSAEARISLAVLVRLQGIGDIGVDLGERRASADAFEAELSRAIGSRGEIASYVTELEQRYDAALDSPGDIPSPAAMVEELEEFLRRQRRDS